VIRNTFTVDYAELGAPVLPTYLQSSAALDIVRAAFERGNPEYFPMWAGQVIGMIHDQPPAEEAVASLVREARTVLGALAETCGSP
jgi:NAD(P)H-dependent flavin oxidoreductase YrpB (nitropropane dioxygenase family)